MSARQRGGQSKQLKRKAGSRQEKVVFEIYCEGEATEVEYLALLKGLPEVEDCLAVGIHVAMAGATPLTLVDAACSDRRSANIEADQHWCIFDVESPKRHPYLSEARDKARANGVRLAITNPCFELWLVLHHTFHNGFLSTDDAVALRKRLDGRADKHLDPAVYRKQRPQAVTFAQRLRAKHEGDGTNFPEDNPSTEMDLLVQALMAVVRSANNGTA